MRSEKTGAAGDRAPSLAHAFLPFLAVFQHGGWHAVGMRGRAAYAVIGESLRRHDFGIVQVAAVDHDRVLQFLAKAIEIEVRELFPLGEDQQGIGALGCFVGGVGEGDAGASITSCARSMRSGIVGRDLAAFLQQRLYQEQSRAIRGCRRCRP